MQSPSQGEIRIAFTIRTIVVLLQLDKIGSSEIIGQSSGWCATSALLDLVSLFIRIRHFLNPFFCNRKNVVPPNWRTPVARLRMILDRGRCETLFSMAGYKSDPRHLNVFFAPTNAS